jgi:hypothetical protein
MLQSGVPAQEDVMDIYSLAAAHIHTGGRAAPMSARAEDCYYAGQIVLPRVNLPLLGSIAMMAGGLVFFGMVLI